MELLHKLQGFREENTQLGIYLAMDNDSEGKKFSHFLETEILKKMHKMPTIYQPFAKDCNEDLKISQIIGNNKVDSQSVGEFCREKIYEYKMSPSTNKRKSILEDFRKLDGFGVLTQEIKDQFNAIHKHKTIKSL